MAFSYHKQGTNYLKTNQFYNGFNKIFPMEICEHILDTYFGYVSRCQYYNSYMHDRIKEKAHGHFVKWIVKKKQDYADLVSNTPDVLPEQFLKKYKKYFIHQIPLAVNWYYHCNCCIRHQIQKAYFDHTNCHYGELSIVTKPQAFIYTPRQNCHCDCDCRHCGRLLSRIWLELYRHEKQNRSFNYFRDQRLLVRSN